MKNHLNEVKKAYSFSRILNPKSRRMKYIFSDKKRDIHNGQRKLLMSEIEFLVNNYQEKVIVLYIGASAGVGSIHTYTLINMFPEFEYHLYDNSCEHGQNANLFLIHLIIPMFSGSPKRNKSMPQALK